MRSGDLFDNVKEAVHRVQSSGQSWLTERDIIARKQIFGVEFFDLLVAAEHEDRMSVLLYQADVSGAELFMNCQKEVGELNQECARKNDCLSSLQQNEERKSVNWLAARTKLQAELLALERKVRSQKEHFGVKFFDSILANPRRSPKKGPLQRCLEKVKRDVWKVETKETGLLEI